MNKLLAAALISLSMCAGTAPVTAHHRFTDSTVVPDSYVDDVYRALICRTAEELIYEVEHSQDPITKQCFNIAPQLRNVLMGVTVIPERWVEIKMDTGVSANFLIGSVRLPTGDKGYLLVDSTPTRGELL